MYGRSLKRFEVVVLIFNILLARASLDECPALIPLAVKSSLSNGACPLPIDNASGPCKEAQKTFRFDPTLLSQELMRLLVVFGIF
jgi:hypothetical protein